MQMYIYIIAMLATLQFCVQVAVTDSTATTTTQATIHKTSSESQQTDSDTQIHLDNSFTISDKKETNENDGIIPTMDHDTIIKVEKNLLTLFGRSKRPKPIDRTKVVIPESLKILYAKTMGEELRESVNLPTPGLHTKSANTVRSFTHEGM